MRLPVWMAGCIVGVGVLQAVAAWAAPTTADPKYIQIIRELSPADIAACRNYGKAEACDRFFAVVKRAGEAPDATDEVRRDFAIQSLPYYASRGHQLLIEREFDKSLALLAGAFGKMKSIYAECKCVSVLSSNIPLHRSYGLVLWRNGDRETATMIWSQAREVFDLYYKDVGKLKNSEERAQLLTLTADSLRMENTIFDSCITNLRVERNAQTASGYRQCAMISIERYEKGVRQAVAAGVEGYDNDKLNSDLFTMKMRRQIIADVK